MKTHWYEAALWIIPQILKYYIRASPKRAPPHNFLDASGVCQKDATSEMCERSSLCPPQRAE